MTLFGADRIATILPHRYLMLLVDQVLELVPGERLTALKTVTVNEPWYRDQPATLGYPRVLLVESWCQSAGVLAAWDTPNPDVLAGQVMLFGSMSGIRFEGEVHPGDVLEHRVRLVRALSDTLIFEGGSFVAGQPVVTVERVVMAMRPAGALTPGTSYQEVS